MATYISTQFLQLRIFFVAFNRQYIDLGDHSETCFGNLEECENDVTLSFRIKPKSAAYREDQVILSGDAYDISIQSKRYFVISLLGGALDCPIQVC